VLAHGTDPTRMDSEHDGMPDGWEIDYGLDPLADDASADLDGDGLNNVQEYSQATDPSVWNWWTQATNVPPWPARTGHSSVVYDGKIWIIGGYGYGAGAYRFHNDVWSSVDGVAWTPVTTGAPWAGRFEHASVVHNGKLWVIGGMALDPLPILFDDVWSSVDGVTWTQETAAAPWTARFAHRSVVHDGRIWVIGGNVDPVSPSTSVNDVWSSVDGVAWTQETAAAPWAARHSHASVAYDGKIWVMGGYDEYTYTMFSDVWSSVDGVAWTRETAGAPWTVRSSHTSVVRNGKIWITGGYDYWTGSSFSDVWTSVDGVAWTQETDAPSWTARSGHRSVVHNDKLWIIGGYAASYGYANDVWASADGISWEQPVGGAPWANRHGHAAVAHDGKLWVIGGHDGASVRNDVWHSTDGLTWIRATDGAPWLARKDHAAVSYDGKIWVMGGRDYDYSPFFSDVWWSADGETWTQVAEWTDWGDRWGHTALAYEGKMWLIGGNYYYDDYYYESYSANDVFYSTDGATWLPATTAAPWPARHGHASVVHNGKMWVVGGTAGFPG